MARCGICFIVGREEAFAAVVAAMQLRDHVAARHGIFVFVVGADDAMRLRFRDVCTVNRIEFRAVPQRMLGALPLRHAHFLLASLLPADIGSFLYLDAATQVWRGLEGLLESRCPDDGFLACADMLAFGLGSAGAGAARRRQYLERIGVPEEDGRAFVSARVIRAGREAWARLSTEAAAMIRADPAKGELDADGLLNVVSAGRHGLVSLRWNFPVCLRACGLERDIEPAIYSFCMAGKPWHGGFGAWGEMFERPYGQAVEAFPELGVDWPGTHAPGRVWAAVSHKMMYLDYRLTWGLSDKRAAALAYEAYLREADGLAGQPEIAGAAVAPHRSLALGH